MTRQLKYTLLSFFILVVAVLSVCFGFATFKTNAFDHSDCDLDNEYCLVCDVAKKVNSLPNAQDITIDNAARVIQQINDIDRIKYNLSDSEFLQLTTLVDTHSNGVDNFVITKYQNAVDTVRELTGVNLVISKSFDLGGESVSDTSNTQVTFEVTNLANNETTLLTLFDLSLGTSAFGYEYYSLTSNGWDFAYKLPKGEYLIKEINLDKPININGNDYYFYCSSISANGVTDSDNNFENGIVIDLQDNTTLAFSNVKCSNINAVANDDSNTILGVCDSCSEQFCYQLLAPTGTLVSDGVTEFNTATFEKICNNNFHFDTAEYDFGEPTISYEYKATESDTFAPTSDYTKAGVYKATLTLQTNYDEYLSVSVEYLVESAPLVNDGGQGESTPEPTPEPTPEVQPNENAEKDMLLIYSVGAATGIVAVASSLIILGTVLTYKKED